MWFRELPEPLLNRIPMASILECTTEAGAVKLVEELPERQGAVLAWLLDLLCSVALHEDRNKMSVRALGMFAVDGHRTDTALSHSRAASAGARKRGAGAWRASATVVGPNLYNDAESSLLSAMESLRFSQQLVAVFTYLLVWRQRALRERHAVLQTVIGWL